jgi:hypothetical protein
VCKNNAAMQIGTRHGSEVKICYLFMMSPGLKELLEKTASWPEEDQEELAVAEIEARRTGRYVLTDGERAAVNNGLEQVRRGEFVSDVEMQSFWKPLRRCMKVHYSPQARNDLHDIFHYLNQRSPSAAGNVMRAIYAGIENRMAS